MVSPMPLHVWARTAMLVVFVTCRAEWTSSTWHTAREESCLYSPHRLPGVCLRTSAYWTTSTISLSMWLHAAMVSSIPGSVWCSPVSFKVPCPRNVQIIPVAGSCRCATTGAYVQTVRRCLDGSAHGRDELRCLFLGAVCMDTQPWSHVHRDMAP